MDDTASQPKPSGSGRLRGPSKPRFQEILDQGVRVRGENLSVVAVAVESTPKAGIATPRSVGCHARRNRQKRRVREALRNLTPLLAGMDIVVLARLSLVEASHQELVQELQSLLSECRKRLTDA